MEPNTRASSLLPATHIVRRLYAAIAKVPDTVPEANVHDALAAFSGDPSRKVDPAMGPDELWESVLNSMLKRQLGWGNTAESADIVRRGEMGLNGLVKFVEYFVVERGVDANLFEGKQAPAMYIDQPTENPTIKNPVIPNLATEDPAIEDPDTGGLSDNYTDIHLSKTITSNAKGQQDNPIDIDDAENHKIGQASGVTSCIGFILDFPAGKSAHSTYPFHR
jgi:hypothetical protein